MKERERTMSLYELPKSGVGEDYEDRNSDREFDRVDERIHLPLVTNDFEVT